MTIPGSDFVRYGLTPHLFAVERLTFAPVPVQVRVLDLQIRRGHAYHGHRQAAKFHRELGVTPHGPASTKISSSQWPSLPGAPPDEPQPIDGTNPLPGIVPMLVR